MPCWGFPGGNSSEEPSCNAGDVRDASSIPGLGRSPGGGLGFPLQLSCLENPLERGAHGIQSYRPRCRKESDVTDVTWHTPTQGTLLSLYQGAGLRVMETEKSHELLSEVGYQRKDPSGATPVQGQEETQSPAQGVGRADSPFFCLFVLSRPRWIG